MLFKYAAYLIYRDVQFVYRDAIIHIIVVDI